MNEQAAGHKHSAEPAQKVVTATCVPTVAHDESVDDHSAIDFTHLKKQLPLARVFDHLGLSARLRAAADRSGAVPARSIAPTAAAAPSA